ncbi:glmZ(sRNA)-inactivating NTPase [Intrasporangium oryzae NRRL B-24470]|uniref:GlmZ(SRNA)-inactivating NTPase n=1 Tax=Intrasporangium oryzae NRRL B-24470 TaxID=1386089 RepID=W9G6M1_9MICO|nr:RNase adapter RapZ [Intrasporangium oryzae]EWT01841.1 glmZ(sRNA)-inactivating NTPase [Intrasporangium oryzae NRRL B-24470]
MNNPTVQTPATSLVDAPLVIVTGMSGAGRSTTANVLEDLGWLVVDNLPPQLLSDLADLRDDAIARSPEAAQQRVAVVVDVRSRGWFAHLEDAIQAARERGERPSLVFLDATDEALVRRFESVRRPHPLQGNGRLLDGIQRERELLVDLRSSADVVIDSSGLNVHQLSAKLSSLFAGDLRFQLRIAVMSFGFKYGLPLDADVVFDMRFLPNPFWVPELRPLSGRDEPVAAFVMGQPGADEFLDRAGDLLSTMVSGYIREGRRYVTVAVGCTGGKHRSVAIAEALSARLGEGSRVETFVVHRDLGRE